LNALFAQQGIAIESLEWRLTRQEVLPKLDRKRRRILREAEGA